jgi:hypothetical protein
MAGSINNYSLGKSGVNVDKSPIHLNDDELTKAQNAIRDPLGSDGGLRKRLGLVKFNASAGADSVKGGIGVPLINQHPDLDGAGGVETLYLAYCTVTQTRGWMQTTDQFDSVTDVAATIIADQRLHTKIVFATGSGNWFHGRCACVLRNRLYYAADDYTVDSSEPPIRVFDGVEDYELCRIPYNNDVGAGGFAEGVVDMLAANGRIYLSTLDDTDSTVKGRVFELDTDTGVLTPIGATFPDAHLPYALAWAYGRLWCATNTMSGTAIFGAQGRVYWIRPGIDSAWTLDKTFAETTESCAASLIVYRGELYAGTVVDSAAGSNGSVFKRTTLGVWSIVDAGAGKDTGISGYWSLAVFKGNLYAAFRADLIAGDDLIIRTFDGTTWSTAFSSDTGDAPGNLFSHGGFLYYFAFVPFGLGASSNKALRTPDGTTWTDKTSVVDDLATELDTGFGGIQT